MRTAVRVKFCIIAGLLTGAGLAWLAGCSGRSGTEGRQATPIRNVLLISLDTCRADYLSCYGYSRKTTPNIDAVAAEGFLFEQAVSPVPLTLPSHCSLLTGTIPPYHGVHDNLNYRLGDSNVTLAEVLQESGYKTAAIIAASVLDSQYGLKQGFETYQERFVQEIKGLVYSERRGEEVSRFATQWLEEHGREKFFLFLHYYDPHAPYDPPEPFASTYADDPYAGEVAYADHCIGKVIEKMKDLGLYDSTLIVIVGDHGESLGEHGEATHGFFIYQSCQRVPWIIRIPGRPASKVLSDWAGLIDAMPTILGCLSIPPPPEVLGEDLRPGSSKERDSDPGKSIYLESLIPTKYGCNPLLGIIRDGWKYLDTSRPELYHLTRDPSESDNLLDQEPLQAKHLRQELESILAQQSRLGQTDSQHIPDPESIERVRALGYLVGHSVEETWELDPTKEDPKDLIGFREAIRAAVEDLSKGETDKAQEAFLMILEKRPNLYEVHEYLGQIALSKGDSDSAIEHYGQYLQKASAGGSDPQGRQTLFTQMLQVEPGWVRAHLNLATALMRRGRIDEALEHLREAVRADPEYPYSHYNLALILGKQGRTEEALEHYREALRLKPDWDACANNLAWILATHPETRFRDGAEAIRLVEPFCPPGGGGEPRFLNTLAAAYAEAGRYPEAVEAARRAIEVARTQGNSSYALKLEARLRLYEAGRPFRQP